MEKFGPEELRLIGAYLSNPANPLKARFRALFTLKNIGTPLAVDLIAQCFSDKSDLLKHELAYCLGQMKLPHAIPVLEQVLRNEENYVMVRHEAGEALGAIGTPQCLEIVDQFRSDKEQDVAETCQLARSRIRQLKELTQDQNKTQQSSDFSSIDPAFPLETTQEVEELTKVLTNSKEDLYLRYKSMFALRNLNTEEATLAICQGFKCKDSALFRHEIAFVLGQLQQECSISALREQLADKSESPMVRHECAEALGAIGTNECLDILQKYLKDEEEIVRESCEVALDICEYEMNKDFQYADGLSIIKVAEA